MEKLRLLCNGDVETLNKLMGQRKIGVQAKTDQNYYFLWLILDTIDINYISAYQKELFTRIRQFFLNIQDVEDNNANQYLSDQINLIIK